MLIRTGIHPWFYMSVACMCDDSPATAKWLSPSAPPPPCSPFVKGRYPDLHPLPPYRFGGRPGPPRSPVPSAARTRRPRDRPTPELLARLDLQPAHQRAHLAQPALPGLVDSRAPRPVRLLRALRSPGECGMSQLRPPGPNLTKCRTSPSTAFSSPSTAFMSPSTAPQVRQGGDAYTWVARMTSQHRAGRHAEGPAKWPPLGTDPTISWP